MRKELTKKTFQGALFGIIVVLVMGIVFLYFSAENFFRFIQGHYEFEKLTPDEINNQIVDVTLKENFGAFLEEYSRSSETHYERSEAFYYVIWTGDDDVEDYRYMAIKVPASYEDKMEEMAENTYNYMVSEPISFSGAIEKMTDEEYRYFKEYFIESGFTEEEFEDATLPYYISVGKLTDGAFMVVVVFAGGAICLVAGIWLFISALSGGYVKKLFKDAEAAGYSEAVVESDYEAGTEFKKNTKVGNLFTYYIDNGNHARALLNRDIVWAYMVTTTHRTNGVKTGTSYSVNLFTIKNKKKPVTVWLKNEQAAQDMVKHINEYMPWAVAGYSDEINRFYHNQYETFLQQRYNAYRPDNISSL